MILGQCGHPLLLAQRFYSQPTKYVQKKIVELSAKNVDDFVQIKGWVRNTRKMKKIYFHDVNDGTSCENIQIVVSREKQQAMPALSYGASVVATGKIGLAPKGNLELITDDVTIIGACHIVNGNYPFVRTQKYPPEYVRNYMHLRAEMGEFRSMLRVRHAATNAFHRYFDRNQFTCIHTPVLTTNSCEGAGELFTVKPADAGVLETMRRPKQSDDDVYFNQKTFLTLSGQLHLEAMCHGMGNVYCFGPAFRAENNKSSIHLSEFYMIEAEESFIDGIEDVTGRIDSLIRTVTTELLDVHAKEIAAASHDSSESEEDRFAWLQKPFPLITHAEAVAILTKHADQLSSPIDDAHRLSKEHELFLVKHVGSPVFVINWPRDLKPFYARRTGDDLVEAVDFLMPHVGELAGGSVRENRMDLLKNVVDKNMNWYLDLRQFGGCTTGGFGIGFERYLKVLLGISSIKDCIPFPRWPYHCAL